MRAILPAALAAMIIGLLGVPGVSAAPADGGAIGRAAAASGPAANARCSFRRWCSADKCHRRFWCR